jgi:hypothetical protein
MRQDNHEIATDGLVLEEAARFNLPKLSVTLQKRSTRFSINTRNKCMRSGHKHLFLVK